MVYGPWTDVPVTRDAGRGWVKVAEGKEALVIIKLLTF